MAKLPSVFNAEKHAGRMGFNVIPKARYKARIIKSEMKKNKNTEGSQCVLQFKIVDGQHKGSIIFTRLNLINANEQAVQIANNELGTICDACKKPVVRDSEELHGIDMWIDVDIKPADANYPEGNVIKNYVALGKAKPAIGKNEESEEETEENEEVEESEEEEQEEPQSSTARRKPIFGGKKK